MALFKCKMCGGSLEIANNATVVECDYCGTQQTLPKLDDEKRANLYDRANHFRRNNEFDKAMAIYEQILNEDNTDAEAYWSIVLCRYGIEYVEDPSTKRRIPTVNRAQFTSILADEDYKSALANADTYQKSIYELEAKAIDEIQKGILAISNKEEPFDVFICYKETDSSGKRTQDSVLAQDLYYGLKNEGFKVFFSRITLEEKLGSAYEPYIFAALNSAKVMVVLGTKAEYFNAVWVKNEWSRFLALIKQGQKKVLIPAYKNMNPYDLPEEFSHLQAQDMSKLGFMQDLIRGIKKIAGKEKKETVKETVIVNQINQDHDTAPLLKRAFLFLEDGDFDSADEYAEKVLDIDPECADAYVVKLLISLKLRSPSQIGSYASPIDRNPNYIKALRFAKGDYRNTIEGYNQAIVDRIDLDNKNQQYANACSLMNCRRYGDAISAFSKIGSFKDSAVKIDICKQNIETDRKERIYADALRNVASSAANDKSILSSIAALQSIKGYKDADAWVKKLEERLEKWYADQKAAEEKERIKAEQDKLEAIRQAELRKIKAERAKKKAIKAVKIGIPSLVALVLVVVLTVTLIIPMLRFNKADKLFAEGKYEEANRIYGELDGFGDSDQRILTIKAIKQIEDKKLEDGIKTLLEAGVPVELTYQTEGGSLTDTQTMSLGYTLSLDNSVAPLSMEKSTASDQTVFTFTQSSDFTGLKTPGRNGYRFVEWELDTYTYDVKSKDATFTLSLRAKWSTKDYTVTYNLVGGKVSAKNVAEYDPEDKTFTLINPTRVGYTFAGWIGTDLSEPTINVTVPTGSYGNRTYTATWKANEYTITYDAAGGTVSSKNQKVIYDSNVEYLIPERAGYKFLGWYENTTKHENGKWTRTSALSLIAKWETIGYTIGYNLNGGTNHINNPSTYKVDTATITLRDPSRTGYKFIGWTFAGQTMPTKTVKIEKGSVGNKTFTANWEAITTTVTFNANGGVCDATELSATYNQNFTLPEVTRSGYRFLGWFNNGTKYESGTWKNYADIELTAEWEIIPYGIVYNLNNGTNNPSNPSTYTFEQEVVLADPTRTGYTFTGWTFEGQTTPTKNVTISQGTTGEKSYTANWEAISSTITLNPNGGSCTPVTIPVTYDQEFTLPECVWSGHTFSGWYIGDTRIESGVCKFYVDTILVAEWDVIQYTISYTMNGGTNAPVNPSTYNYHNAITLATPERTGYTFLGWTFAGQTTPTKNVTIPVGTTGNKTYTANWGANTYTVTFDANVGTVSPTTMDATFDTGVTLPTPTRTGYTFAGWFCGDDKYSDGTWLTAEDITLVAQWTPRTDITYVVNHYQQNADDDEYTLESTENLTGTADAKITPAVKSFAHFISPTAQTVTIAPDGSLVVNYYYDRVTYDLTYVTNGGDTIEKQTYKYDQTLVIATPTRAGYTFGGWFTNKTLSTAFSTTATLNANKTIYAYWSEENKPTDFTYSGTSAITVSAYNGTSTTMWIPAYIGGVSVTTIPASAFKNQTALIKVVVPNTVTSIGSAAFRGCSALESLSIPFVGDKKHDANSEYKYPFGYIFGTSNYTDAVSTSQNYMTTYAGDNKFNVTSSTYYIPKSLKVVSVTGTDYIQYGAFYNCNSIEKVTLLESTSKIRGYAFYNCSSLQQLNSSTDGEFNIPAGVTTISYYSFYNCDGMTATICHNNATKIEQYAFYSCNNLKTINIPSSIKTIGDCAFEGCVSLSTVNSTTEGTLNLLEGLEQIGVTAFRNASSLTTIIVPDTVISIGSSAFNGCKSLTDITLPFVGDSIKSSTDEYKYSLGYIFGTSSYAGGTSTSQRWLGASSGDGKFYVESSTYYIPSELKTVTITGGYINYGAFSGCNTITTISIPVDVTYIGQYAFYGCTSLASLNSSTVGEYNIPAGVTKINPWTFYDCDGLTHLNLHEDLTRIDEHAFYACTNLEFVSACDNVNYIGYWAFYNCQKVTQFNSSNVREMIIPSACTYIGTGAFYGMNQITDLYVGASVEEIGNGAFAGFATLENLTIPFVGDKNKTTSEQYQYPLGYIFGTSSYTGGKKVTQYYVGENINSYTSNTYYIPEKLKNVVVTDDNVISLGSFHNCSSVENITIPTSATYIGNYAFLSCTNLKRLNSSTDGEINIPQAVAYLGSSVFNGCSNISKVTTGNSLETIGYRAFYGCTALVQFNGESVGEFIIPDTVTSIGRGAFYGSKMVSLTMPFVGASENSTSSTEVSLGHIFDYYNDNSSDYLTSASSDYTTQWGSSTSSYKYLFYIPDTLRIVTITKQTNIPYAAFMNCDLLTTITIPSNVESIGGYAFYNCKSLSKLNGTEIGTFNIPPSVTKIEKQTFRNCLEATNITLSNFITAIDEYAFAGCAAIVQFNSDTLSELKIPTSCTSIGTNAFNGLAIIANVIIPDSVETIGSAAFRGCSSIKSMTLPFVGKSENCTSTGCMTFGYIFGYYSDTTSDNLTSTHSYTTQYNSATASYKYMYYIPKSIETVVITKQTSIPYAAFMNCDLITSITLPDNTISIGGYAFYNCKKLSSLNSSEIGEINIPSYVTAVEKYTFYNCIEISDVSLSDKVTAINDYAFYGCSAIVKFNSSMLGEMIIPASCEKIGDSAFYGLSAITNLKVSDMVSAIGAAAFGKMTSLQEMTVPFIGNKNKTSVDTYQYPFGYFFGTSSYSGGTSTKQYYYGSSTTSTTYSTYYIPTTLTKVVVTIGDLNYGAFYGCSKITSITANDNAVVNAEALHSCSATLGYASYTTPNYAWDGRTIATGYHSGSGTLNDPYIIANGDELAFFAQQVNAGVTYEGVYFKLSYDISLGNYEFGTIGTDSSYFKGVFDGDGHTISGLTINSNQQYVGLFSQTSGIVKNLGVYGNVTQTTETNLAAAGMLVGQLLNGGTISDCYTVGTFTSNSTYTIHCGGLVGYSKGTITNSYSSADVKATSSSLVSYAGGLVGYLEGTVTNSVAYGDVYAKGSTDSYSRNGGFVGSSSESATITNCYRSNAQVLTKNGVANTAYNEFGTTGTMSEILNFCKANWNNAKWIFVTVYPLFK